MFSMVDMTGVVALCMTLASLCPLSQVVGGEEEEEEAGE